MRRSLTVALLLLASAAFAPVPMAGADDPPVVILGPAPFVGPDVMIRADGSSAYVGADTNQQGRIEQRITSSQRAVSYVRVCANTTHGRMRVHGTGGGRTLRVRYRVGSRDVTRSVLAGSFRTASLRRSECARRIRVVGRLAPGATSGGHTLRIRATAPSGARDSVSTHVTVGSQ
ncbi:hypothetical protein ACVW00_003958 [Marmoricola sp. URHA0025 HA25]